jgi:DNA topoisomerase VI subunit A
MQSSTTFLPRWEYHEQSFLLSAVADFFVFPRMRTQFPLQVAAPKGEVVGKISFQSGGNLVRGDGAPVLIPSTIQDPQNTLHCHEASFVLVVEKDTVFNRCTAPRHTKDANLMIFNLFDRPVYQRNYHLMNNCIMVTGRGYPDIATRVLVNNISQKYPQLPIYGLYVDDLQFAGLIGDALTLRSQI